MTPITTSIIHTLAFYDAVGKVPLTKLELYKYLIHTKNLPELSFGIFLKALDEEWSKLNEYIACHRGFYFLSKNIDAYRRKIDVGKTGVAKWRIAKRMIRYISFLPYIRMVGVTGSLALHTTNTQSDIDVLIVVKSGHIWTTRILVSFLMHIFGRRRHGAKTKDRICLNHYIADSDLALRPKNLFSAHIYSSFIPMWGDNRTKKSFIVQNKFWAKFHARHTRKEGFDIRTISKESSPLASFLEIVLNRVVAKRIESLLKTIQVQRIQHSLSNKRLGEAGYSAAPGEEGTVIFDDAALVFHHPRPRNQEALYLYKENLRELGMA